MTTRDDTGSVNPLLGVDTGGTFTDFVFLDDGRLHVHKQVSTPSAPERAVIDGFARLLASTPPNLRVVHGSTVATNAVLEGKGARTAYVTNTGLGDVLTIGRQARRELYELQPAPQAPPVPAELCFEVDQRLAADGTVVKALTDAQIDAVVRRIESAEPDAVAINLLYSFLDDTDERRLAEAMPDRLYVSRSSAVLPEYKEYERGIATWLNAALGPTVGRYLQRLKEALGRLAVMHGAAGTVDVDQAAEHSVNLLLSGPAAGLLGARHMGRIAGHERVLTFDMGGTSTDVALIDRAIRLTSEGEIAGYPVAVPMVDMHTIGAGGGSIAYLDAGRMLRVGPESAGADPGPACYGAGGDRPTVTDANVVLGRLPASTRLGGDMALDVDAAHAAVARVAEPMGVGVTEAASGIVRVANEAMAKALRVISVQRGEDPREYSLLCFGGAGGMHVCALADALEMRAAVVPVHAGVLSALGMLVAPRSRELSRSVLRPLNSVETADVESHLKALAERGRRELVAEGVPEEDIHSEAALDLRYLGQSFTLDVSWRGLSQAAEDFHAAHEARYGHRLDEPVELVNVHLRLRGPEPEMPLPEIAQGTGEPRVSERVVVHGCDGDVPVYERDDLAAGHAFRGPAVVREPVSTTWVAPGWRCGVDAHGNLLLGREA